MSRPLALGAALAVAGVAVAGCGGGKSQSSGSSGSGQVPSGVTHAESMVKRYSAPAGVPKAGPPVKGVAALKGKKIWFVPQSTEIPYQAAVVQGARAAAAAAGLRMQVCNGGGTPSTESACVQQAITGGGAGVAADGITVGQIQQAVNGLKARHIPFVQAGLTQQAGDNSIAYAWNNSFLQSTLAADAIIAASKGRADILVVRHTDSPATESFMDQGGLKELKTYCPGCRLTTIQTNAAQLSQLTGSVSAALEKNPNVNAILAEFDLDVQSVDSSLQSLNKKIPVYSTTALLPGLQNVKKGSYEAADAGTDPAYAGWAAIDQLIRMMVHAGPVTNVPMPVRLFTKSNISSVQLTNAAFVSGAWYGATGFESMFRKLWGL